MTDYKTYIYILIVISLTVIFGYLMYDLGMETGYYAGFSDAVNLCNQLDELC